MDQKLQAEQYLLIVLPYSLGRCNIYQRQLPITHGATERCWFVAIGRRQLWQTKETLEQAARGTQAHTPPSSGGGGKGQHVTVCSGGEARSKVRCQDQEGVALGCSHTAVQEGTKGTPVEPRGSVRKPPCLDRSYRLKTERSLKLLEERSVAEVDM